MGTIDETPDDGAMSDGSEDSYARQEREFALYSQVYHDTSGCNDDLYGNPVEVADYSDDLGLQKHEGLLTSEKMDESDKPSKGLTEPPEEVPTNTSGKDKKSKSKRKEEKSKSKRKEEKSKSKRKEEKSKSKRSQDKRQEEAEEVKLVSSSESDDSDIQVVKQIVTVAQDLSSDEESSESADIKSQYRKSKLSSKDKKMESDSSDEEEDMPFWSRIDSGVHTTDNKLSVHIHTHGRQRHDSIISHASSALGDNDTANLVTLKDIEPGDVGLDYQKMTLDDILDSLPDEGWDIMQTDYTVGKLGNKGSLKRYHNLKCRNCDNIGHLSYSCPEPKKQKVCGLCSGIHQGQTDTQSCPRAVCGWCKETGHPTKLCKKASYYQEKIKCKRCRQKGHRLKGCHELWRQWYITTESNCDKAVVPDKSLADNKKMKYCCLCGNSGHTGFDCGSKDYRRGIILPTFVMNYNTEKSPRWLGRMKQLQAAGKYPKSDGEPQNDFNLQNDICTSLIEDDPPVTDENTKTAADDGASDAVIVCNDEVNGSVGWLEHCSGGRALTSDQQKLFTTPQHLVNPGGSKRKYEAPVIPAFNKKHKNEAKQPKQCHNPPIHNFRHGNSTFINRHGVIGNIKYDSTGKKMRPSKSERKQRRLQKIQLAQGNGVPLSKVLQIPNASLSAAKTAKRTTKANQRKRKRHSSPGQWNGKHT